jgi:cytochrome c
MRKLIISLLALAALVGPPAQASEAIMKKARCNACHTIDTKRVGPPYKEVAARYRGDAGAPARLFEKVRKGGSGNWGDLQMLPHTPEQISDADLEAVIHWILSLQ